MKRKSIDRFIESTEESTDGIRGKSIVFVNMSDNIGNYRWKYWKLNECFTDEIKSAEKNT